MTSKTDAPEYLDVTRQLNDVMTSKPLATILTLFVFDDLTSHTVNFFAAYRLSVFCQYSGRWNHLPPLRALGLPPLELVFESNQSRG